MNTIRTLLLALAMLPFGCFVDPNEEIVIGSCRYEGDPVYLEIATCQEYFEERHGREGQKDVCRQNGGTWSDDPCDTEQACGHCVEPRQLSTKTTCFYPTENVPSSDAVLQSLCEDSDYEEDHWIENPDVSCE